VARKASRPRVTIGGSRSRPRGLRVLTDHQTGSKRLRACVGLKTPSKKKAQLLGARKSRKETSATAKGEEQGLMRGQRCKEGYNRNGKSGGAKNWGDGGISNGNGRG